MSRMMNKSAAQGVASAFLLCCGIMGCHLAVAATVPDAKLVKFGEALFFDVNFSLQRTQSCATCHLPGQGFVDKRPNRAANAVSLGDDNVSLGTRNAPTLSYAASTPSFHVDRNGEYRGGFFLDGRAHDLATQAKEPFLNPIEMALPDAHLLAQRLRENPNYTAAVTMLFGAEVVQDDNAVHSAVGQALAAFQKSPQFSPFDSKYDRFLRGEYRMTEMEERGRILFFSSLINCNLCHLLDSPEQETFTDYRYHNIGTPPNPLVQQHGTGKLPDLGLLANPLVEDTLQAGKFKVPTLRNIAVTGPYMHNGVFAELRTVLEFYNQYIIADTKNPETGKPWRAPEVADNISQDLLQQGQPMDRYRIETLIAFFKTLTDRQFEHLLED